MVVMTRREFFSIIRQEPKLANKLMWSFLQVLTTRLRTTNEDLRTAREAGDDRTHSLDILMADDVFEVEELGTQK